MAQRQENQEPPAQRRRLHNPQDALEGPSGHQGAPAPQGSPAPALQIILPEPVGVFQQNAEANNGQQVVPDMQANLFGVNDDSGIQLNPEYDFQ